MNLIEAHDYVKRRVTRVLEARRYRTTCDPRFPAASDDLDASLNGLCADVAAHVVDHHATIASIEVFEDDDEPGRVCVMIELTCCGDILTRWLPILGADQPDHSGHGHEHNKLRLCA